MIVSYTSATMPFSKLENYLCPLSRLSGAMTLPTVLFTTFAMGLIRRPLAVRQDPSANIQINPRARAVDYPAETPSILSVKCKDELAPASLSVI